MTNYFLKTNQSRKQNLKEKFNIKPVYEKRNFEWLDLVNKSGEEKRNNVSFYRLRYRLPSKQEIKCNSYVINKFFHKRIKKNE